MTDFQGLWGTFAKEWAATALPNVPALTAAQLSIEPTPASFDAYCKQRIGQLRSSVDPYTAPELHALRIKELNAQVLCEAVYVANCVMSNELARRVGESQMEHEEAITFVRSSRSLLNALLPPHLHMSTNNQET